MEWFIVWLCLSIAIGVAASNKGRSGAGFFLLSLLLSPLVGGVFVLACANLKTQPAALAADEVPTAQTHVRCPDCRELVRMDARKCKHCSAPLVPQSAAIEPAPGSEAYRGANRVGTMLSNKLSLRSPGETSTKQNSDRPPG